MKQLSYKNKIILGAIPLLTFYSYSYSYAQTLSLDGGQVTDLTSIGTGSIIYNDILINSLSGTPTLKLQLDLEKINSGEDFIGKIITNQITSTTDASSEIVNLELDIINNQGVDTSCTSLNGTGCFYITNYDYHYKDLIVNNGSQYNLMVGFSNNNIFPDFKIRSKYYKYLSDARLFPNNPGTGINAGKNIQYYIFAYAGYDNVINLNYRARSIIEDSFETKTPLASFDYNLLAKNNNWDGTISNPYFTQENLNTDKALNSVSLNTPYQTSYNENLLVKNVKNAEIEFYADNSFPVDALFTKRVALNNVSGLFTFNDPLSYLKSAGQQIDLNAQQSMIVDARTIFDLPEADRANYSNPNNVTDESQLTADDELGGYWFSIINNDASYSSDPLSVSLHLGVAGVTPKETWQGKGLVVAHIDTNNLGSFVANNNNNQKLLINARNSNGQLFINDPTNSLNIVKGMELYGRNVTLNLLGVSTAQYNEMITANQFEDNFAAHYSTGLDNHLGNSSYLIFASDNSLLNVYGKENGSASDEYFYNPIYGSNFGWNSTDSTVQQYQDTYTTQVMNISGLGNFNFKSIKSIEQIDISNNANVNFYNPVYANVLNINNATLNYGGNIILSDNPMSLMFFDNKQMNINLSNKAVWNINDNTTIAENSNGVTTVSGNINVNDSLINLFNSDKRAISLNVNSWNGSNNGKVHLGVYFDNSSSDHDKITAKQIFGTTELEVYNKGASYEVLDNPIQVFEYTGNQNDTASKIGKFVMKSFTENGNTYSLTKDSATANHYIVNGQSNNTPEEQLVINIPGTETHILAAKASIEGVQDRIHSKKDTYFWANGIYNQFKIDNIKNNINLFQLGIDKKINEDLIAGGFIDYGDISFNSKMTDGDGKSYGVGLYLNKKWNSGENLSLIYRHSTGNVKYKNYASDKKNINTNTFNAQLAKDFHQENTIISPFVDYTYIKGSSFTLSESNLIKWQSPKVNFNELSTGVKLKIKEQVLKPEFVLALVNTNGLTINGNKNFTDGLFGVSIQKDTKNWNVKGSLSKRMGTLNSTQANISVSYKW